MIREENITDMTYITQVAKGNIDFINEMVDIFLSKTPETLQEIERFLEEKNWEMVGFLSHKLKATYAYMGINSLKEILLFIEKSAKAGENLSDIPEKFNFLTRKTEIAILELQQYRTNN
jgi:HPt (histidine-containing phosphotransfer) domain-containing protein